MLLSVSGQETRVISLNYLPESVKVYNFEVADWHTYFVGMWAWLVHNNPERCISDAIKRILKIGLDPKISLEAISRLKGLGKAELEKIAKKIENISDHLKDSDITGAVRDLLGNPVKINGKIYDHLKEVQDALTGLGKQIENINREIAKGTFSDDVLKEAERIRSVLSKQKDEIQNILNKASK